MKIRNPFKKKEEIFIEFVNAQEIIDKLDSIPEEKIDKNIFIKIKNAFKKFNKMKEEENEAESINGFLFGDNILKGSEEHHKSEMKKFKSCFEK